MNHPKYYLFVINPVAGGKDKAPFYQLLERSAADHNFQYDVLETKGVDDESALRQKMENRRPDRVAAIGGDGTVQLVAKTLTDYPYLPLGIIPYGSANGLATELELSPDPAESLKTFLTSMKKRRLDAILINDQYYCFHFADVGVNADLIKDNERDRGRGLFTYAKYLIRRLEDGRRQEFKIRIDDRWRRRSGFMVALANATRLGTGVVLNRCGDICDGYFEMVIVKELRLGDLIKAGLSTLNPEVEYGDAIECISCRKAEIALSTPRYLQIDGELAGEVSYIRARIEPQAITVLLPE